MQNIAGCIQNAPGQSRIGATHQYLLGHWHLREPLPYWTAARVAGRVLIPAGLVPIAGAFAAFVRARGTPVPVALPPSLVVHGFYRYVRNPSYGGFLIVLAGQALLFGSRGLVEYAAVAWCIGATAVRWHEEPVLARKFGPQYETCRAAVRAWIPRLHPWTP